MIDFKISNSGDLVLHNSEVFQRMKVSFAASEYPVARVTFLQEGEARDQKPVGTQLLIRFHTREKAFSDGKSVSIINEVEEIRQRIMFALRTEYGDIITKKDFGSEVFRAKHLDINSAAVQKQIEDAVLIAINGILEEPNVIVKPEYYDGTFFCQNINIYVLDGNSIVYDFNITG